MSVGKDGYLKFNKDVFSVLSKDGTHQILESASSKLESKRGKWHEFGLSKRQYYSRLRDLKGIDLIEKVGEGYVLTNLGQNIYKMVGSLESRGSEDPSKIEEDDMRMKLFSEEGGIFPLAEREDGVECIEILYDFESLIESFLEVIETAEEELYIASNYTDSRIIKALLKTDENLTVRGIGPNTKSGSAMERLRAVSSFNDIKRLMKLTGDFFRRSDRLPYSFALKDHEYVGLELTNPAKPNEFFLGVVLRGKKVYEYFLSVFYRLYKKAGE